MTPHTLSDCQALDRQDPLRKLRDLFQLPEGVIYLDGNSLGVLPKATPARVAQAVAQEWGNDLIKSWNTAGWFQMPLKVGNKIAGLIGARDHEVVAADSTSINLFKVLSAALSIAKADHSEKNIILSEEEICSIVKPLMTGFLSAKEVVLPSRIIIDDVLAAVKAYEMACAY